MNITIIHNSSKHNSNYNTANRIENEYFHNFTVVSVSSYGVNLSS